MKIQFKRLLITAFIFASHLGFSQCTDCFIVEFNTEAGDSGSSQAVLPLATGVTVDIDMNNNGSFTDSSIDLQSQVGLITLTFWSPGEYTVVVKPSSPNGNFQIFYNSTSSQKNSCL